MTSRSSALTSEAAMIDLYEAAVREWIARKLRGRGHKHTRDAIRNVRYGIEEGYGSDVTPADEPAAALICELKVHDRPKWATGDDDGYIRHSESIEHLTPAELVQECLAIHAALQEPPAPEVVEGEGMRP